MSTPLIMDSDLSLGSRLVWVLNRDTEPYTEKFRDEFITVPPNKEKKVKMPFLEARQFLGQGKPPAEKDVEGNYLPGKRPKALYTIDLTVDELGGNSKTLDVAMKATEAAIANKCMICNKQMGSEYALKVHLANMHPDASPGVSA
jgi:hypothetical protein